MVDAVYFTVPGEPVAKGRARAFIRAGHVAHYTPDKTARYENLVAMAAEKAMFKRAPCEFSVVLEMTAFMTIPTSWSEKKKEMARRGEVLPTKRPDLDNIVKAIKDGMNGIVWKDDSQVVEIRAKKQYGDPRVFVQAFFECK